jgi:hypothetical protein
MKFLIKLDIQYVTSIWSDQLIFLGSLASVLLDLVTVRLRFKQRAWEHTEWYMTIPPSARIALSGLASCHFLQRH